MIYTLINWINDSFPAINATNLNKMDSAIKVAYEKPTGQKNLVINSRKLIQQRALTGGRKQVIEAAMNLGGVHTISFTGAATATIYEFPALLADYATTIADGSTNTLGSGLASGDTVTPTAGYYIAIEFTSTDFNNVQLELGNVATNLEIRHNELELCLRYFEALSSAWYFNGYMYTSTEMILPEYKYAVRKRIVPILNFTAYSGAGFTVGVMTADVSKAEGFRGRDYTANGITQNTVTAFMNITADAEIFNTTATYKEDRWFI